MPPGFFYGRFDATLVNLPKPLASQYWLRYIAKNR